MGFLEKFKELSSLKTARFKGEFRTGVDPAWHTDFLPTGIACVDCALGGGFGYGRLSELYGSWSSGKTMLLYYALIANQRLGGLSMLVETEGAFDEQFFRSLGGDPEKLLIPNNGKVFTIQDTFDFFDQVCKAKSREEAESGMATPIAIGWDSIAATPPKHLIETGMETVDMSRAKAMSQGCSLVGAVVQQCRVAIIACNQLKETMNTDKGAQKEVTPGGRAWPFHSSQRLQLEFDGTQYGSILVEYPSEKKHEDQGQEIGRAVRGYVEKNKLASPFGRFTLPIYTKTGANHPVHDGAQTKLGIDVDEALFDFYTSDQFKIPGTDETVISQSGGRYKVNPAIAPNCKSFYRKQWLEVLEEVPGLRSIYYDFSTRTVPSNQEITSGE